MLKNEIDQYEAVNEEPPTHQEQRFEEPIDLEVEEAAEELDDEAEEVQIQRTENKKPARIEPGELETNNGRSNVAAQSSSLSLSSQRAVDPVQGETSSLTASAMVRSVLSTRLLNSPAKFCRKLINKSRGENETGSVDFRLVDQGVPIGNRRYATRRPRSADVWLDHQPRTVSKLGKHFYLSSYLP